MTDSYMAKVDLSQFQELFIGDLNWHAPDIAKSVALSTDDGRTLTATNVSSFKGLRVWVCDEKPGSALEAQLDRLIAKTSTDRLVIFHDDRQQVWRWPVRRNRDSSVTSRLTSHKHIVGDPDPKFASRLGLICLPFDVVLDANAVLSKVRDAFDVEAQNESKRASKLMATMYAAIEKAYPRAVDSKRRDHEISVTLARILFLMFGDDTEMWATDAFRNVIQHETAPDGSDLGHVLNDLFEFLDTARPTLAPEGFDGFKYVNGGIFEEKIALPPLNREFRDAILTACSVDWSSISPAIFGSMFQSVRDADTRRALGEHYTSEENILKTLNPLFLGELRADLDSALGRDTPKKRINALEGLWKRLGEIRFMDPACGCGNFIIIAYRELRDIELRVMEGLADLRQTEGQTTLGGDLARVIRVTLDHFYGIEIDEWPAKIAQTAMFMMDRQCDLRLRDRFGDAPERLPIKREATIVVGNALVQDWATVCPPDDNVIVVGNPPFLGHATRTDQQAAELRAAWGTDDISRLDYVTGWHAKALKFFADRPGRWAFVTTNSITQGDPVPHLFRPIFDKGWVIRFAHRTFPWTSEAAGKAAVHCVIVGFARPSREKARLFDASADGDARQVANINGYLLPGPSVFVTKRTQPLSPGLPEATFGNMPRDDGNLIVDKSQVEEVRNDPIASRYLRPFLGADEVLNGRERWCLWMTAASARELEQSPVIRRRIEAVLVFRARSSAASTRAMAATPHLFGQRPALHSAPYVVIPRVSSERRPYYAVRHVDPVVIASDATFTASDPDGYLFGVISSAMFIAWQRAVGGRLKSDLRFSNTIVWNNLPLPAASSDLRADIAEAGRGVIAARQSLGDLTLAQIYSATDLSPALQRAHDSLDALVDVAFGAGGICKSEEERGRVLFMRFDEMTRGLL